MIIVIIDEKVLKVSIFPHRALLTVPVSNMNKGRERRLCCYSLLSVVKLQGSNSSTPWYHFSLHCRPIGLMLPSGEVTWIDDIEAGLMKEFFVNLKLDRN